MIEAGWPSPEARLEQAARIRAIIRDRRWRDALFGARLFEDPAWDILLDLYAAYLEEQRVSVSSLCIAAAVAPTTALRWIAKLIDAGVIERSPDPHDRRRAFVTLSATARAGMATYFAGNRTTVNPTSMPIDVAHRLLQLEEGMALLRAMADLFGEMRAQLPA